VLSEVFAMRLINVHTLEMKEFFTETLQKKNFKYAILCHTWGEKEISLFEYTYMKKNPDSEKTA